MNDAEHLKNEFLAIIKQLAPEAIEFNPTSQQQLQQLLFAPFERKNVEESKSPKGGNNTDDKKKPIRRSKDAVDVWEAEADEEAEEADSLSGDDALLAEAQKLSSKELKTEEDDDPMKVVRNLKRVDKYPEVRMFRVEKLPNFDYSTIGQSGRELKTKYRDMPVKGFGIPPEVISETGLPSVDTAALKKLVEGQITKHFQ